MQSKRDRRVYNKAYHLANKAKHNSQSRAWYAANKERIRQARLTAPVTMNPLPAHTQFLNRRAAAVAYLFYRRGWRYIQIGSFFGKDSGLHHFVRRALLRARKWGLDYDRRKHPRGYGCRDYSLFGFIPEMRDV